MSMVERSIIGGLLTVGPALRSIIGGFRTVGRALDPTVGNPQYS